MESKNDLCEYALSLRAELLGAASVEAFFTLLPGAESAAGSGGQPAQRHRRQEPGMKHRFWVDEKDFCMLVVSFGEWTVEDQIRHEDDYGRAGKKLEL